MKIDLCISVVLYRNTPQQVEALLAGISGAKNLSLRLIFIDNDPGSTKFDFSNLPAEVSYWPNDENLGYGRAHNLAILDPNCRANYHLIANPDVRFTAKDLTALCNKMAEENEISLLMPKIVWPDGTDQGLRKLLPRPADLLVRRFLPKFLQPLYQKQAERYEMKALNSNKEMRVPVLSGCFMFCRGEVLRRIKGFDPRFFLYLEDVDLSRRLGQQGVSLYWPEVSVVHEYQKSSYQSFKPMFLHLRSAWLYFNKYGWLVDRYRENYNREALSQKQ
jgi:hypothetical protein